MFEAIQKALWPIIFVAGLGAFIDFVIGEKRQEKVKLWLMARWARIDDLKWTNFTEKEARFAIELFDALFGSRLLSWKRFVSCVAVAAFSLAAWTLRAWILLRSNGQDLDLSAISRSTFSSSEAILVGPSILLLAVSISLTRWISLRAIAASLRWRFGYMAFFALLCLHVLLFFYWRPVSEVLRLVLVNGVIARRESVSRLGDDLSSAWQMAFHANVFRQPEAAIAERLDPLIVLAVCQIVSTMTISYLANALRLIVASGMLLSFVTRRWIASFFMLLWERVIEDKKGAFTLVFGGIAVLLGAVKELFAHI